MKPEIAEFIEAHVLDSVYLASRISNPERCLEDYEENFIFPARLFEKATGFSGVSQEYIFPDGLSPAAFDLKITEAQTRWFCAQAMHELVSGDDARDPNDRFLCLYGGIVNAYKRDLYDDLQSLSSYGDITAADWREAAGDAKAACEIELLAAYDELKELNPVLNAIPLARDDFRQISNVVAGVTSNFNVADITTCVTHKKEDEPRIVGRTSALTKRLVRDLDIAEEIEPGIPLIGWMCAPSTFLKIEQQLDKREQKQAAR